LKQNLKQTIFLIFCIQKSIRFTHIRPQTYFKGWKFN